MLKEVLPTISARLAGAVVATMMLLSSAAAFGAQAYLAINLGAVYPNLTYGLGSGSGQEVGMTLGTGYFATLWNGTSNAAVNLHPSGFNGSYALATDGATQVGYAFGPTTNSYTHAARWSGSAASFID